MKNKIKYGDFDFIDKFHFGFAKVNKNGKWNYINEDRHLISDLWFDWNDLFFYGYGKVGLNDKCNFINKKGKLISNTWLDDCCILTPSQCMNGCSNCYIKVKYNSGKNVGENIIDINGNVLLLKNYAKIYHYGIFDNCDVVKLNDKYNIINILTNKYILKLWVDDIKLDFDNITHKKTVMLTI